MEAPRFENGYTMISNEILEKVYQSDFNATQHDIILLLLRYTYGFHRETAPLSITFISNGIGKDRDFTAKQIRNLQKMNVIKSITTRKGITKELKFNTNFDEWTIVQKDYSVKGLWSNKTVNYGLIEPSTMVLLDHQENKNNKENLKNIYMCKFQAFYSKYPKKQKRLEAEKAFLKLKPDDELFAAIMAALENQKQSDQWQRDNGQYIPLPSSWLNGRRWEDEPTADGKEDKPHRREYTPEELKRIEELMNQ